MCKDESEGSVGVLPNSDRVGQPIIVEHTLKYAHPPPTQKKIKLKRILKIITHFS